MRPQMMFVGLIVLALLFASCSKDYSKYIKVQEQRVGDYSITILSSSGEINKGTGDLLLEFRKIPTAELVNVSNLNLSAVMQMAGNPMSGELLASETGTPGRFVIKYNFGMTGTYNLKITFENGLQAQFVLFIN